MDNLTEGKSYRLVVQRSPLKDKEGKQRTDMFGVIYTYRCILTNNRTSTEKDIITFYNERGASENNFDKAMKCIVEFGLLETFEPRIKRMLNATDCGWGFSDTLWDIYHKHCD